MKIHTILACDEKWGIARGMGLPWNLEKESAHYHRFITNTSDLPPGRKNVLIMGRKTWTDEDPVDAAQPLSDTYQFILSNTLREKPAQADGIVSSVEEFVKLLETPQWKDKIGRIFNIGGGRACEAIYGTKYCGRAYISRIKEDFQCDTFAPDLDEKKGFKIVEKSFPYETSLVPDGTQKEENGTEWIVNIYERNDLKE